jgi:PIN domain nuclease of toxin-antitoxin system
VLVLDTHALVWWTSLPQLLSAKARKAIERAETLIIPSIAFWETSLLVRRGKLDLGLPVDAWAELVFTLPRCRAEPLTPEIALLADALAMHPDPADRFIVATALKARAQLVTKDRLIRAAKLVKTVW